MRAEVARALLSTDVASAGGAGSPPERLAGRFAFPADADVFRGHFPGAPLVPGVYLIEAVRLVCERGRGERLAIERVVDARFTREVLPAEELSVEVRLEDAGGGNGELRCRATVCCAGEDAARIRLDLRPEEG